MNENLTVPDIDLNETVHPSGKMKRVIHGLYEIDNLISKTIAMAVKCLNIRPSQGSNSSRHHLVREGRTSPFTASVTFAGPRDLAT